jgi:RimJ/RimL family protein N-acetyltransferase
MKTIIETERLLLTELGMDAVGHIMEIFSDPIAMQYYPSTKTEDDAIQWINRNQLRYETYGIGLWAAILKEPGVFAGMVGLVPQDVESKEEVEIGYLFIRSFWGNGYATEGAIACRDYGFNHLGHNRLVSIINPDNNPSIRVAERVGMHREKRIIQWGREHILYSMNKKLILRPREEVTETQG